MPNTTHTPTEPITLYAPKDLVHLARRTVRTSQATVKGNANNALDVRATSGIPFASVIAGRRCGRRPRTSTACRTPGRSRSRRDRRDRGVQFLPNPR